MENFRNLTYHTFSKETLVLCIICKKCENEYEKIFNEKESIEIQKILTLIKDT